MNAVFSAMYNKNVLFLSSIDSEVIVGMKNNRFWSSSALTSQNVKELDSEQMWVLIS